MKVSLKDRSLFLTAQNEKEEEDIFDFIQQNCRKRGSAGNAFGAETWFSVSENYGAKTTSLSISIED